MHSTLPEGDSPSLGLVQPTDKELTALREKGALEWRGALPTPEVYVRREEHLASQALCQNGGHTNWALVDTSLPPEQRQVLSGCSTIRKRALVRQDDQTHEVNCHAVGDVFCPPEFRKRGYGARMMRELSKRLPTWQKEKQAVQFSVLYSDIGKRFYDKNGGWVAFPSAHVHLQARELGDESDVQLLEASQLHRLCALDEQILRRKLERRRGTGLAVALVPEQRVMAWHHAREEFVAGEVLGRVPAIKGALTHTRDGRQVWCVWNRMYYSADPAQRKGNTLHILRMAAEVRADADDGDNDDGDNDDGDNDDDKTRAEHHDGHQDEQVRDAMVALLAAAQHQAHEWVCSKVELWNPEPVALAAAQCLDATASIVHRETDSITALAWYGGKQEVEWLMNEKYGWS